MKYFARSKKSASVPQACGIWMEGDYYCPVFLHTAVNQDRPVGSKSTFQSHIHDFYHLVLYTKGQGFYLMEGVYQPAQAGTCVLISPGQRHEFITRRGNTVYSEITFVYENSHHQYMPLLFEQVLSLYSGAAVSLPRQIQLSAEALQQFQNQMIQITDFLNSSREHSLFQAHRRLALLFDFLIERSTPPSVPASVDERFGRVRLWIEEHYQQTVSMDELARMAGVSRAYFFRTFKKAFGISPLAYQQGLRIEAAKTLLHATSLNCGEIAGRTGFESVCFFHRVFRKHVGMTPRQYLASR
jgi:AraC-like DNA-binding protein